MSHHHHRGDGITRVLAISFILSFSFVFVQIVASLMSGSLALLADAGHTVVDSTGLLLAVVASMLARRPADAVRSYGYARVEVLVVPLHVLLMFGIAGYIGWEAFHRLGSGHTVDAMPVIIVGFAGLVINLVVLRMLHGHMHASLNTRGAYLEVLADAFASVGVMLSAVVIVLTGWMGVDIVVAFVIAALILPRAVRLLWHSVNILLETAPRSVSVEDLRADAGSVEGVRGVHDLHIWSVAPHFTALSAHIEVEDMDNCGPQLASLSTLFRERHGIAHVTLQPETAALHQVIQCCAFPDAPGVPGELHGDACVMPGAVRDTGAP